MQISSIPKYSHGEFALIGHELRISSIALLSSKAPKMQFMKL